MIATLDGAYSEKEAVIAFSFAARTADSSNWIDSVSFNIANGSDSSIDVLTCSVVASNATTAGSVVNGGTIYSVVDLSGLQSTVTITLWVRPNAGKIAEFQLQLSTTA